MKKKNLYKKYKVNPQTAKPGDLMRAARMKGVGMVGGRPQSGPFLGKTLFRKSESVMCKTHGVKNTAEHQKSQHKKEQYSEGREVKLIRELDQMHKGMKASKKMSKKPKLGTGKRFSQLKGQLSRKGAKNPGGLAAYIGRKKYGNKRFQGLAAKGKK